MLPSLLWFLESLFQNLIPLVEAFQGESYESLQGEYIPDFIISLSIFSNPFASLKYLFYNFVCSSRGIRLDISKQTK